jgi:hypothetical protein
MDLPLTEPPAIAECRLDREGLREQGDRYRRLSVTVEGLERRSAELVARFSRALDEELLAETLAVERECCEFFRIDYDRSERELIVRVDDPELDPALDALRDALTGVGTAHSSRS